MKKIVVKEEYLDSIKSEEKFINAIQLGRILGAIQYNKNIHAILHEKDENLSVNLQLHLMINHAALLFEGIKKFEQIKSEFDNLKTYKKNIEKIKKILREYNDENSFISSVLKKIRNRIAFHFDKSIIKTIFSEYVDASLEEDKEIVLLSGESELKKDTSFMLSDNISINYILGLINKKELTDQEKFKYLAKTLLELSELFCDILDELIPELSSEFCENKEE